MTLAHRPKVLSDVSKSGTVFWPEIREIGQFVPTIHGVSGKHVQEFFRFRPGWWWRKFREVGLECYRSSPLYLHSPYDMFPYRFVGLRDRLGEMGGAAVQVFWLRSGKVV